MSSVLIETAMNQANQIFPMSFPNRSVKILRHKNWYSTSHHLKI